MPWGLVATTRHNKTCLEPNWISGVNPKLSTDMSCVPKEQQNDTVGPAFLGAKGFWGRITQAEITSSKLPETHPVILP